MLGRSSLLLVALLAVGVTCAWADDSRELARAPHQVREAVARLAAAQTYESEGIGEAGDPSPIHAAFVQLREGATSELMRALTRHKSPVVRLYAFEALLDRGEEVQDVVVALARDTTEIETQEGCEGGRDAVADRVLERGWVELGEAQRVRVIESLFDVPGLRARRLVLLEAARRGRHEEELRALAAAGEPGALRALAVFRRDGDRALVLACLADPSTRAEAVSAIAEWPLPEARDVVRASMTSRDGTYPLRVAAIEALAAYGEPEPLLEAVLGTEGIYRDVLVRALTKVPPCSAHDALLAGLVRLGHATPAGLDRLASLDRQSLRAAIAEAVGPGRALHWFRDGARRRVVELVEEDHDTQLRADVVCRVLEADDSDGFVLAAWVAARDRQKSALPMLFRPIERRSRPVLVVAATRALLAYKRDTVDSRLDRTLAGWRGAGRVVGPHLRQVLDERPRAFARPD